MSQFYFDPSREDDTYSLPDGETFYVSPIEATYNVANLDHADEFTVTEPGWYYWTCFPGCMPDSPPDGPYDTEDMAIQNARGELDG